MKIGFMGATGSFSEQAADLHATTMALDEVVMLPLITADSVLSALANNDIDRGVFPVVNSTGGIVVEAMHAMGKFNFIVETMFDMDIHHMLLVKEGILSEHITTITSHDQAIKQCQLYLDSEWTEADIVRYRDTAQAASDLSSGILPDEYAVIAPRRCAEIYGLKILESGIQDLAHNKTTFVVVRKDM